MMCFFIYRGRKYLLNLVQNTLLIQKFTRVSFRKNLVPRLNCMVMFTFSILDLSQVLSKNQFGILMLPN